MFRRLFAALAACAIMSFASTEAAVAAVDVNQADAAQLETIKGIGPAISAKIIAERRNGNFKDWDDLVKRVPGIGDKTSATMSQGGLTVGGRSKADAPGSVDQGIARATRPPTAPPGEPLTKTTNSMARPAVAPNAVTTETQSTKRTSTADPASAPATTETKTTKTVASPVGTTSQTKTSKTIDNDATAKTEMAKSKTTEVDRSTTATKARPKTGDKSDADDTPKK